MFPAAFEIDHIRVYQRPEPIAKLFSKIHMGKVKLNWKGPSVSKNNTKVPFNAGEYNAELLLINFRKTLEKRNPF